MAIMFSPPASEILAAGLAENTPETESIFVESRCTGEEFKGILLRRLANLLGKHGVKYFTAHDFKAISIGLQCLSDSHGPSLLAGRFLGELLGESKLILVSASHTDLYMLA